MLRDCGCFGCGCCGGCGCCDSDEPTSDCCQMVPYYSAWGSYCSPRGSPRGSPCCSPRYSGREWHRGYSIWDAPPRTLRESAVSYYCCAPSSYQICLQTDFWYLRASPQEEDCSLLHYLLIIWRLPGHLAVSSTHIIRNRCRAKFVFNGSPTGHIKSLPCGLN